MSGYNLRLTPEVIGGHVPFIDSAHVRFNRGGLTIDAASAIATRLATQGQVVLRNGRAIVLAGSFIGLNAGTGRWEVYTPASGAVEATLDTGILADDNALTWDAVTAGAAGNNVTIEMVDTRRAVQALTVNVAGNDIEVLLEAAAGGVLATGTTGAADSELEWTSELPGVDGNVITIDLVNDGTVSRAAIDIVVTGTSIAIYPVTDMGGVITSIANDIIAEVAATPAAADLVMAAATGAGTDPVGGDSIVLAGGVDSAPASTATEVIAAIVASGAASALVTVDDTGASTGAGVVVPIAATNLDGGVDIVANNIAGRRAMIVFTEADLGPTADSANAVVNGIDHGRVIDARLPLAADGTIRGLLPQVTFV